MNQFTNGFKFVSQPDLKEVSELICNTWARPCWNYDEGLLKLHIMRPTGDPELAIGQKAENGDLVSFQAYMPFQVEYFGKDYKSVFASFLTVSSNYHGKGLAGPQQGILIDRAIEKGYDLYITMCEVGAASNRAVEKIFAKKGLHVEIIKVLNYSATAKLMLRSSLPEKTSGHTREYRKDDKAQVAGIISDFGKGSQLRKVIPEEDIDFLFLERPHTRSYVYEKDGRIRGLINLLILEVLDEKTVTNLYFENVYFGDLSTEEQIEFLGDVLLAQKERDYFMAFVPDIGYFDMAPFDRYRFRKVPRQLNLYLAPLKKDVLPEGIKAVENFYMDVY